MELCRSGGQVKLNSDLVVCLAGVLWGEALDFLAQRGVPRDEAEAFADKLRWEIEGLLDHVR